jgi:hypothetical protein
LLPNAWDSLTRDAGCLLQSFDHKAVPFPNFRRAEARRRPGYFPNRRYSPDNGQKFGGSHCAGPRQVDLHRRFRFHYSREMGSGRFIAGLKWKEPQSSRYDCSPYCRILWEAD